MINSALNAGVTGIQSGMQSLQRNAHQVANANRPPEQGGPDNLIEPIVGQVQSKLQVEASANVVATASETLGTLIDIEV